MKKYLLTFLISLFCLGASAQAIRGGLVLGVNTSQIDGDNLAGFYKFGLTGGLYALYPLGKRTSILTEIRYSGLGSRDRSGINGLSTRHVEVPLILKLEFPLLIWENPTTIRLEGGLVGGYLLGATDAAFGIDRTDLYPRYDIRWTWGGSVMLAPGWELVARYGRSLIPFLKGQIVTNGCFTAGGPCHEYVQLILRYEIFER